jgi:cytochrome c oxidase subunit IV
MARAYTEQKKIALKTILILAVITVGEVMIALTGKGYIIDGFHMPWYIMNLLMIGLSLWKAYLIVSEFMHLGHEVRAMGLSIILPMFLLVWAIIAFMYEGEAWKGNREKVEERNEMESDRSIKAQGMLIYEMDELNRQH